jgi:predicted amidohydrolase YtcJ
VLEEDPFVVNPLELKDIRVMLTSVDGRIVFERPRT